MIGIVGFGYVGKAISNAFTCDQIISDPLYNKVTIHDIIKSKVDVIFICVPTPDIHPHFKHVIDVLKQIQTTDYEGIIAVKSTVCPGIIDDDNVCINPEFLSQKTANIDFIKPKMMVIGGQRNKELLTYYNKHSIVSTQECNLTDNDTACLIKYTVNCFAALKIHFMNIVNTVAQHHDVNYKSMISILKQHPWLGTHHFDVPGPDGSPGFGGACLPKDMSTFAKIYDVSLFDNIIKDNQEIRTS